MSDKTPFERITSMFVPWLALVVALGALGLNALQSPVFGWNSPFLWFGQGLYESPPDIESRTTGFFVSVMNTGRAPAKDVFISILDFPRLAKPEHVKVPGYAFEVVRCVDGELLVKINALPSGQFAMVSATGIPFDGFRPRIDKVYNDSCVGHYAASMDESCQLQCTTRWAKESVEQSFRKLGEEVKAQ